ncbi:cytochrome P450 [Actinoplanes sp. URMC 104]|uniref:cytochrome P450 n=1 Tax=Actinoplanes sp. URMC 104 TaxID=3423409 RepID=UPI003F1AF149
MSVDMSPMPATERAQWLPPSQWPTGSDHLFTPGPFRAEAQLPVVTRYAEVRTALLNADAAFSRVVPFAVIPAELRHRTLYASWGLDGAEHRRARQSLAGINRGSSPAARRYTRELTERLTRQLLQEPPPWDLSRVIYAVSMQVVVEHTMQAPVLLPYVRRLRELTRDHVAAAGGFFGIRRDREAEKILSLVVDGYDELPAGLARHLGDLHRLRPEEFSADHLVGQLWLLAVSSETQATQTASLVGMLLETGEYAYARDVLDDPAALELLVAEAGRRGIVFPASMVVPRRPVSFDGQTLDAGRPCLISYAAANLDPAVFEDPLRFDPRRPRNAKHLAFGVGDHRCQGEAGAEQFVADVTTTLLRVLPPEVRLHDGLVHRETGISMSVACLPVTA